MKLFTVSALLCAMMAMSTVAALSNSACPHGWTQFYHRCFLHVPTRMTWARAERNCQSMAANLASVHSSSEYHLIQSLTARYGKGVTWIGGTDASEEGIWLWSDGRHFHYRHWCQGEPNNAGGGQHCLQINYSGRKCWDDERCNVLLPSICVRKI